MERDEVVKIKIIPPSGCGKKIYEIDPLLLTHRDHLDFCFGRYLRLREDIDKHEGGLDPFSRGHENFGFRQSITGITYREWAPGAKSAALIGDFNNWNPNAAVMTPNEFGVWEIFLPNNADGSPPIPHGSRVKEEVYERRRRRDEQDEEMKCMKIWGFRVTYNRRDQFGYNLKISQLS